MPSMELLKEIGANLRRGTEQALELIRKAAPQVAREGDRPCACQAALEHGIWSDPKAIPAEVKEKYRVLIGKRLG